MIEVAESRDAVTAGRSWDEGPGQSHLLDVHHAEWLVIAPAAPGTPRDGNTKESGKAAGTEPLAVFERTSLVPELRESDSGELQGLGPCRW